MKLNKHKGLQAYGRVYWKWSVTLSEALVKSLGWKKDQELEPEVSNGVLILRKRGERPPPD